MSAPLQRDSNALSSNISILLYNHNIVMDNSTQTNEKSFNERNLSPHKYLDPLMSATGTDKDRDETSGSTTFSGGINELKNKKSLEDKDTSSDFDQNQNRMTGESQYSTESSLFKIKTLAEMTPTKVAEYLQSAAEREERKRAVVDQLNLDIEKLNTSLVDLNLGSPFPSLQVLEARESLAHLYLKRYEILLSIADLDQAFNIAQSLFTHISPGDPALPELHYLLGLVCKYISQKSETETGQDMITRAIMHFESALSATSTGSADFYRYQISLADARIKHYAFTHDIKDLDAALDLGKALLEKPQSGDFESDVLLLIGKAYFIRGTLKTRDDLFLNLGLENSLKSLELLDPKSISYSKAAGQIREIYTAAFQISEDIKDEEAQFTYFWLEEDHSSNNLPRFQSYLGFQYSDLYQTTDNLDDLEKSHRYFKLALVNTPLNDPDLVQRHAALGFSFSCKFQREGHLSDLEGSLKHDQLALENTPSDDPDIFKRHGVLTVSFSDKYRRLGDLADLEEALKHGRLALEKIPPDHPDIYQRHAALAVSFIDRYQRLENLEDLDKALEHSQLALSKSDPDDPDMLKRHTALSALYADRYQRLGDLDELEKCLTYAHLALEKIPSGHADIFKRHEDLAIAYSHRYQKFQDPADLESSIKHGKLALEEIPSYHPDIFKIHSGLGDSYTERYKKLGDISDLDMAVEHHKLVLEELNKLEAYPNQAYYFYLSMGTHHLRYTESQKQNDHDYIISLAKHSLSLENSFATSWMYMAHIAEITYMHDTQLALDIYIKGFENFSDLVWIGSSLSTRNFIITESNVSQRIATAVSIAIKLNNLPKAVEFLEQGLAVISQQQLQLQTDYKDLQAEYPSEATQLKNLSEILVQQNRKDQSETGVNFNTVAIQRNKLIMQIREKPNFEGFLKSPPFPNLVLAACSGPIVLLNCTDLSSDAIIIFNSEIKPVEVVRLDITPEKITEHLNLMHKILSAYNIATRDVDRALNRRRRPLFNANEHDAELVCSWLKEKIVQPVFEVLNKNNVDLGRIWWCTSGIMTHLPVHAGAPEDSPYVQSYTPSLSSLIRARKERMSGTTELMTAVGVTKTMINPDFNALTGVPSEIDIVKTAFGEKNMNILLDQDASADNVLGSMKSSPWLHLACHGTQDHLNPLKSSLYLYDQTLEINTILNTQMPSAKFVFLSACQTAMGDAKLANESMHLTGAFITAGFQGAVGTLWSISDSDAPYVAKIVYGKVVEKGEPDVTLAAEGLDMAVKNLRKYKAPYHRWVPFVHFGI